ncbi:hypothetical protein B277_05623 [Janibacter hoylei PVAS-1]|uniref:Rhodanese domain-containing protein n=1 Tax=Janibacter hoylei PVAS-1 TaxID=1210046 RepID=K1EQY3_9MICO|nr:rhodanese-like domain-containing protein [Janibacter hoylei]EKA61628.1 hypothetical protein B277_05623 [Janibacter hoylei PVAS-1]
MREAHELAAGSVPGAVHIPVPTLTGDPASSAGLPTDRDIVLVCHSGARARLAATTLRARGFVQLHVLDGGMLAWPDPVPLAQESHS